MNHAKILDCTLRDGAYLVDKKFGDNTIRGIIKGLVKTKIDFIEIGFLQDEGFGKGKTVFKNSADAQKFVPIDKEGCQFTLLADYSRYSISNLDICTGMSIDAVRECFFKHERFDAIKVCNEIKEKGYKLFIQPVDILGYSDKELLEFIDLINDVEPYCLSIVDTFGSMYQEDLNRIFELINHNLVTACKIGFHSHNNMQMSNALSQEFLRMSYGKREVIVDGTISGMGRGAGNTPTELMIQYMVSKLGYHYDLDSLLDIIDGYMDNIKSQCSWGYSTPYFIAGCYNAHVNNIAYLKQKNSIRSRDMRFILNKIGKDNCKRYDYQLLEDTYIDYLKSDIDDNMARKLLQSTIAHQPVLVIVPGNTLNTQSDLINNYINQYHPIIISVNFIPEDIEIDYLYMSNTKRYHYWSNSDKFLATKKILTSNIKQQSEDENTIIISFTKLVKCGWEHSDNSTIMLLRLLDQIFVDEIAIAGFDGYDLPNNGEVNYVSEFLELSSISNNPVELNREISKMLNDFRYSRTNNNVCVKFITKSRFEKCFY